MTFPISTIEASQAGALAGFQAICPECGMVIRDSNESSIRLEVEAHEAYHEKVGR
jgi:hypothetical protein